MTKTALPQINLQQFTTAGGLQFCNGFILYLSHPLPGKMKALANILQTQGVVNADAKKIAEYFLLAFGKGAQAAVNFGTEAFMVLQMGSGRIGIRVGHQVN